MGISTLLAPAIMEFAPHADAPGAPTRIVAKPGTLVLLSGDARWKWVHRAMPHPDAADKARISLVLGCRRRRSDSVRSFPSFPLSGCALLSKSYRLAHSLL